MLLGGAFRKIFIASKFFGLNILIPFIWLVDEERTDRRKEKICLD